MEGGDSGEEVVYFVDYYVVWIQVYVVGDVCGLGLVFCVWVSGVIDQWGLVDVFVVNVVFWWIFDGQDMFGFVMQFIEFFYGDF